MAQNTNQLEGYTVFSSVSLNGSGATLKANDLVVSRYSSTGTSINQEVWASIVSATQFEGLPGTALKPPFTFTSEVSLGLFRSATSTIQPSYGTFDFAGTNIAFSSGTTAQSASTAKVAQGQMLFSVLSLTTNGAAIYFRSGNSTYVWPSSGVIG